MPTFDPKRPIESFKALVLDMMKGYRFDVEGLYLKDGTIRPLPSEAAVVGKVVEVTIHEHLSRKLLQQRQLKSIPEEVPAEIWKFSGNLDCVAAVRGLEGCSLPPQAHQRDRVEAYSVCD